MSENEMRDLLERLDGAELGRFIELAEVEKRKRWSHPLNTRFDYKAKVWERRP